MRQLEYTVDIIINAQHFMPPGGARVGVYLPPPLPARNEKLHFVLVPLQKNYRERRNSRNMETSRFLSVYRLEFDHVYVDRGARGTYLPTNVLLLLYTLQYWNL